MKSIITTALGLAITFTFNACGEKQAAKTPTEPAAAAAAAVAREAYIKENGGTFTDTRDGKTYKTVKISEQVWMTENLNYEAAGSICYDEKTENCQKYGRLYDWNTAKTACPSGWHLPSNKEWQTIVDLAGGKEIAGKALKASSGWKNSENGDKNGNGTDKFGFSALPGGHGNSDGSFNNVGSFGYWWSAIEYNSENAYDGSLSYSYEGVYYSYTSKSGLRSIRCIKD
jgi:uncharacterized protein (TIGR02145 family)